MNVSICSSVIALTPSPCESPVLRTYLLKQALKVRNPAFGGVLLPIVGRTGGP